MNKNECELFLEKLLDAEAPDQAAALLGDPHASRCSGCYEQAKQNFQLLKTIDEVSFVAPPVSIQQHFYQALHQEMDIVKQAVPVRRMSFKWIAAACLLLVAGAATVYELSKRKVPQVIVSAPVVADPSSSGVSVPARVNGISMATDGRAEDPKLVATLVNILERDKNPHVRMAAFYGLTKYKGVPEVHNRLVTILQSEQDPMMQVLLINFLTETKEPHALDAVRSVIINKKTRKEVKALALSKI
jgi:hypothetical protein